MSYVKNDFLKVGSTGAYTPTTSDLRLSVEEVDAVNNAVTQVLEIVHQTSGTPATGIGVGQQFKVETSAGNVEIGATIEAVTTDVTGGSEDFDLVFKTMVAGAAAVEQGRFSRTGTATHTSLMLYDVDNNTVERVTVGAADSGGVGFKVLRIPN